MADGKNKNLKTMCQELRSTGTFYTQHELAVYLKSFFPNDVGEIYDPTCGAGGLLEVFGDDVKKYGQDIDSKAVRYATDNIKNFTGAVGDTLENPAFMDRKFRYIIANPPFSIKWNPISDDRFSVLPALPPKSKADYAFIAHILYMLDDYGTAVVLAFPGILYRGNAEGKIRKWLVENNFIDTVVLIDGGHFVDTSIATVCLVMQKNRTATDVKFVHNEHEKFVTYDEIERNDFNLSVSCYIDETPPKEPIDPLAVEMLARQEFLNSLERNLSFSLLVSKFENIPLQPFIDDIQQILNKYKAEKL